MRRAEMYRNADNGKIADLDAILKEYGRDKGNGRNSRLELECLSNIGRETDTIKVGGVLIGGDNPISAQSMCSTKTADVDATVRQIEELESAGCDIVRVAVPDMRAAKAISRIRERIKIPLVADIHFDYRLALAAVENGADKIRINPGNIGGENNVRAVARACESAGIPIRVGVNSGSVPAEAIAAANGKMSAALAKAALDNTALLENCGFGDICISVKASNVYDVIGANIILNAMTNHPLHLGVTEAGTKHIGIVKSSAALSTLLLMGIGDTIRVSLTDDPVEEVRAGIDILKALKLREGVNIVSCPTCGRTEIDIIGLAKEVEKRTAGIDRDITIAVMGCAVNGPGEAREADYGIAGGKGEGLLFKHGEIVKKLPESELVDALMDMIKED